MSAATMIRPAPASVPRNGLPEWRPYVYRGTGEDELTAWMDSEESPAAPSACWCDGSMRAYRKHLADGEEPCQASRDDINLYHRERRAKRGAAS